jgi:hypothetical protein
VISFSINGVNYKIDVAPDARLWVLRGHTSAVDVDFEPRVTDEAADDGADESSTLCDGLGESVTNRRIATRWAQRYANGGEFDAAQIAACDAAAEIIEWDLEPAGRMVINATLPPPVTEAVVRIFSADGNLGGSASFFPTAGQVN